MFPVKLLLLALSAIRFFMTFHVADGNSELNWLLEMLSTCRGRSVVTKGGSSCSDPLSRLKLTSRTMMLPEDMISGKRSPEKELYERLICSTLVRSARDGEMHPSSPLDARETSVTALSSLQAMPSHSQQSVPFSRHDMARPPSRDSPERKRRRLRFSCSVHAVERDAKRSSRNSCSTAGGMVKERIGWCFFLPLLVF
uniref:Secreted protein n=1 Tax=Triticum urartu TaxID=4572 RepID=A0A8R7UTF0_TRIUA